LVFNENDCGRLRIHCVSPNSTNSELALGSARALRHSGAMPGDVVAILGIGGLGHLVGQFANKLGFRTVAIARGADKEQLSRKLGAHHFIDSATQGVAAALNRLGGARAVLATVTNADAMSATPPARRRKPDDRGNAARTRRRGLCADDARRRALPNGADDGVAIARCLPETHAVIGRSTRGRDDLR